MEVREVCFYCADQNPQRDRTLGITNYTFGLLKALKQSGSVELQTVASKSSGGVPDGIPTTILPFRTDHAIGRLMSDHLHPLIIGNRIDPRIWHYPKGFLPFGFQVRQPKVGTIADTILQFYADHYPHQRSRAAYAYWIAMLKNAVRKFDIIITVSEFSKRSILEFADCYKIKEPTVVVTYEGVSVEEVSGEPRDDYVLHLASRHPHKRTTWLLSEWQKLQAVDADLPKLKLIGEVDSFGSHILANLKNVELLPALDRKPLLREFRRSRALILPSEIEGFGLPALESYYCGTPVMYVKGTAVEEVLGTGTPGGFEFEDGSFAAALTAALNTNARETAIKRSELQQRFAWSNCIERTIAAYRALTD